MSYFLKISHTKKGDYLQIYESYRDKTKHTSSNRVVKSIGYVSDLKEKRIADPINYYKNHVKEMNVQLKTNKERKINNSPIRNLGYFLIDAMFNNDLKNDLEMLDKIEKQNISTYLFLKKYISKNIVHKDVKLFDDYNFEIIDIIDKLKYLGKSKNKIINIFNHNFNNNLEIPNFNDDINEFEICNLYEIKESRIYEKFVIEGCILISLLSNLIIENLNVKVFKKNISSKDIAKFISSFNIFNDEEKYINLCSIDIVKPIANILKLNLEEYYLTENDINKILKFKI